MQIQGAESGPTEPTETEHMSQALFSIGNSCAKGQVFGINCELLGSHLHRAFSVSPLTQRINSKPSLMTRNNL